MKYKLIDVEDESVNTHDCVTYDEIMKDIIKWNQDFKSEYKTIEEFNNGEKYYQIIESK